MLRKIEIIILFILATVINSWTSYDDIRTGRVQLFDGRTTNAIMTSSNPTSTLVTFSGTLTVTRTSGLGIVGIDTYVSNYFSVNITITNFVTTGLRLTLFVLDDTVLRYLTVHYIAVGADTYFAQVKFNCFLPTVLSSGVGFRAESQSSTTVFTNNPVTCNNYLSGFRIKNGQGINNYLQTKVSCPLGGSVTSTFSTAQNNTISLICYTTVIFCQICTKNAFYYQWGALGSVIYYLDAPYIVNINMATIGRYEKDDRRFWGLYSFNISRGNYRSFDFDSDYSQGNFNSAETIQNNTFFASLNYFFIATRNCDSDEWFSVPDEDCVGDGACTGNLKETLSGSARFCDYCHYSCKDCDGALSTDCDNCNSTNFRTESSNTCPCNTGYVDVGVAMCSPCQFYITGCTDCLSVKICITCQVGYTLIQGICICTNGFLVTGICTTLVGCISATNLGGSVFCLACNTTLHFTRADNFTCVCDAGFYLDSVEDCIGVCGDSLVVDGEGCDDGNTRNGDGCNSKCQVQTNYYCNNANIPSSCFIVANITAKLKYVKRNLSGNTAYFGIDVQPYYKEYLYMDFGAYVSTNIPCSFIQTHYIDGLLRVTCQYARTIQGDTYSLNVTLDDKFFKNGTVISLTIPTSGMNAKLTYDSNYAMSTPLEYSIITLDVIAIIALLISCVSQRMIGVEMIQTLQSVLYTMVLVPTCPSTLAPLQMLRYTNGFNQIEGTDPARRFTYSFRIGGVGLDQQFLLNYNVSFGLLLGVISIMIGLKLLLSKFQADKAQQEQQFNRQIQMKLVHKNYYSFKKAFLFIFERIFFILAFMNMFLVFMGVGVQLSSMLQDYSVVNSQINTLSAALAICIMAVFLVMVVVSGLYPNSKIFPFFMNHKYPIYYVIYNTFFIIFLAYLHVYSPLIYIMAGMILLNLIILLVFKPYPESIHNITIVFDQITILISVAAYIYADLTPFTDNNENLFSIMVVLIVIMLYICVILSFYRLYRFYKYMKANKLAYYQSDESDKDKNKNKQSNGLQSLQLQNSKELQNIDPEYYEGLKENKNPLNNSKDNSDNAQTHRNFPRQNLNNTNNQQSNSPFPRGTPKKTKFQITPIDPKPIEQSNTKSNPYNQFGQIKLHNFNKNQQQYDALKAIKARLRKDFYHKIRGQDIKQAEKQDLLDKTNSKPASFIPDDHND